MALTSKAIDAEGAEVGSGAGMIIQSSVGRDGGSPHARNISYYDINKVSGPFLIYGDSERSTLFTFWDTTLKRGSAPFSGSIANNGTQIFLFNRPYKIEAIGPLMFLAALDLSIIG